MFWKKSNPRPLGVPLEDLRQLLQPTSINCQIEGNALVARHEYYTTRVEVVPPDCKETENGTIRAVVRVVTELPAQLAGLFASPEATTAINAMAALGALTRDRGRVSVGSRPTVYEAENAWRTLHLPLLLFTVIGGAEAILGAMRRGLAGQHGRGGGSKRTEGNFAQVESYLSRVAVCTTGGLGLTAEFGLARGAASAAAGDRRTALFRMAGDEPPPELGGGLFCLLQMPHRCDDEAHLDRVCAQLNGMEMAGHGLPPHFGAWCGGRLGNNPAYVTFLPNALHPVSGIAVNVGIWAMHRAQWANGMLASMGVRV